MGLDGLARREREIMQVLFRLEKATAVEIQDQMEDPPTNSAIRALLRVLEGKGHIAHFRRGRQFVYVPVQSRREARQSALKGLVDVFFEGSPGLAAAELLEMPEAGYSPETLSRLRSLVDDAEGTE